ncbi:unnamed protein product [Cochlearia groenlandica]
MDSGSENPRVSKRRFQPRQPKKPSPSTIPPISNTEAEAEAEEENKRAARLISKRIGTGPRKPKAETKASSSEVTFQPNFSSLRSFGVPKEDDTHGSDDSLPAASSVDNLPAVSSADNFPAAPSATAQKDEEEEVHNLVTRTEGSYVEPWDLENSYYPTVLPLRKPYSGDPELLDQEEFGEVAEHHVCGESSINAAKELGLTTKVVEQSEKQMFFFKIPDSLPIMKQKTGGNTKRGAASENISKRDNPFEGLPEGHMGKMLVYKSGAVKMKLGDVLFDVSPGPDTKFASDVAAIDTKRKHCCRIGSSPKLVTVTPDIESDSDTETRK